jgi:hypothetical protein
MAKFVYKNATVVINSVDLSSQVEQVTVERKLDEVEVTAFGDTAHNFVTGLENNKLTLSLYADYSASSVHATLSPLVGSTTTVVVKPTANATSTTNPSFTMTALISNYMPVDGKVGDVGKLSLTFPVTSGITQATA